MGFGQWLKQAFNKVKNGVNDAVKWVGSAVQKVAEVVRPYAGMAADVVSTFNPALGAGLKTGFDAIDGASRGAAKGGLSGAISGGIQGAAGSILNRGKEPPDVWQDDDDDD
jgi:phage-related protein